MPFFLLLYDPHRRRRRKAWASSPRSGGRDLCKCQRHFHQLVLCPFCWFMSFFLLLYDPQRHFHQLVFWPLANVRQHVISFFKFNHTIIILWPLANVRQHVNLLPIHCKYPHCCNSITSQSQQNMQACWVKKKYSSTVTILKLYSLPVLFHWPNFLLKDKINLLQRLHLYIVQS